jgi:hypothetical protein
MFQARPIAAMALSFMCASAAGDPQSFCHTVWRDRRHVGANGLARRSALAVHQGKVLASCEQNIPVRSLSNEELRILEFGGCNGN